MILFQVTKSETIEELHWEIVGVHLKILCNSNMKTKTTHNCGLRKLRFLTSQIEHEAWDVLQFEPQIKKQILMHESSKTRLLMTTEKSDSRKAITTLMLGEFRIQQVGISLSSTI
nr:hypothetical protein [Tanacetum cinerariifolium]